MKTTNNGAGRETPVVAEKQALRKEILAWRASLSQADWCNWSSSIESKIYNLLNINNITNCFIYVSKNPEVDTHALIDRMLTQGIKVYVPWQPSRTQMEACAFPGWEGMVCGPMDILIPSDPSPFTGKIDVAITPGLAFSEAGARLGYGAGYYDRWFEKNPLTRRIAISFDSQVRAELPLEEHDLPMHEIITERRSITINHFN